MIPDNNIGWLADSLLLEQKFRLGSLYDRSPVQQFKVKEVQHCGYFIHSYHLTNIQTYVQQRYSKSVMEPEEREQSAAAFNVVHSVSLVNIKFLYAEVRNVLC